jgi:hypothetical protein
MPDLLSVMFGPWVPDVANIPVPVSATVMEVPVADCLNVYFANGNYRSLPTAVEQGTPLPAQCLGCFTAIDQEGSPQVYAGTRTHLYHWNGSGWTDVSGGQTFFAAAWSFAQFGPFIIAAFTPPQVSVLYSFWFGTVGTRFQSMAIGGSAFAPPTGSPSGSVVGVINQFAVLGDIWSPPSGSVSTESFVEIGVGNNVQTTFTTTLTNVPLAPFYVYAGSFASGPYPTIACVDNGEGVFSTPGMTGTVNYVTGVVTLTFTLPPTPTDYIQVFALNSFPYRVQWSAIGDQTQWPTPLTNAALAVQAGYEDLTADFGQVQYIAGFPQFGIVFQRFGITRMTYVGGSVVFTFAPYEKKHGALNRNCVIAVDQTVYFVSDEGFYSTDGNSVTPIGTSADQTVGIDQWFKTNVNQAALGAISAGYDANTRSVMFAVPTGANTLPDTLLLYNPVMQRWTKAAIAVELLWADNTGAKHQIGIIDQAHTYATLTGSTQAGYVESCDLTWPDGMTRYAVDVRPIIACTDTPTAQIGTRNAMDLPVKYSRDQARNKLTKLCSIRAHGQFTRVRISSSAAAALTGAGIYSQTGGPF